MLNKVIIWDFNRTIYNPDQKKLIPGAKELLKAFQKLGYLNVIYSKNKANDMRISRAVHRCKILKYLKDIVVRKKKDVSDLRLILNQYNADINQSFLISDRTRVDIEMGNSLGLKTIWIKSGKFANQLPETEKQEPTLTINSLGEIKAVLDSVQQPTS